MEKNCAPLPSDIIPQIVKTPMKGSELDFNNENKEEEKSDGGDSGYFTPFDPNKPPKKKKNEDKIEVLGKEAKADLKFKIIVVGNMGVGKSCLALRATEGVFKENLGSTLSLSINTFNVKINNTSISLQIWDTCGQEKFRALIRSYYTNSSLAIIVYSVTDKDSYDDVNIWYKYIKENVSDCKIFLIANKIDSPERIITYEQGNKCRNDFNFDLYMETSAESGFNSQELFINAENILKREHDKMKLYGLNPNKEQKMLSNIILRRKKKNNDEDDDEEYDNEGGCCA